MGKVGTALPPYNTGIQFFDIISHLVGDPVDGAEEAAHGQAHQDPDLPVEVRPRQLLVDAGYLKHEHFRQTPVQKTEKD